MRGFQQFQRLNGVREMKARSDKGVSEARAVSEGKRLVLTRTKDSVQIWGREINISPKIIDWGSLEARGVELLGDTGTRSWGP